MVPSLQVYTKTMYRGSLKYLTNIINYSLKESTFLDELKQSEVIPVFKKPDLYRRRIIDQRVYYHTYQKSLKE